MAKKPKTPKEVIQKKIKKVIMELELKAGRLDHMLSEPPECTELGDMLDALNTAEWGKFEGVIKEEEEFLTPHLYY